ncbi:SPOR domain-containing protein [Ramlibacter monticola]|uniref:SPOR domain-containing protein n=1 Tax=Ramlibacter monticola TaxID=1926872 RepID=A0A936YY85_9BURK|nr:SPOR domain-containing protein [Ramlibacter monticola]MBL0390801.1 SPOR domain-containing protein [Ramlibacter monticola]
MPLFKLRKKVDEPKAAPSPAESIEVMRRRARHRLIGAVVLVLVGVVGFPLLFDTQPRPVAVDIPIEIPDRNKVKPLPPLPPLPPAPAPAATGKVAAPAASTPMITESRQEAGLPPVTAPKAEAARIEAPKAEPHKAEAPKAEPPRAEAPKAEPRHPQEAAKAQALLEGKSVDTAGGLRYVVQVGAFAERDKARQAQQKLDRAGLRNYTNVAETRNGPRIRVRAGPFASRAEADRAAEKIKGLALPAAVLSL